MTPRAPYGSWSSPFTRELIVESSTSLGEIFVGEQDVYWSELRPAEAGRVVVCRRTPGGEVEDVLPEGFSARTRVHEYGGGAWCVHDDLLVFSNWSDQRLYLFDPATGDPPRALTPEPLVPGGDRYADARVTRDHHWVVCVREHHEPGEEARNEIVAVPIDGDGAPVVLVSGPDFVSFPRPSPDGELLCWTQWDHPAMPWDESELWVAGLTEGDRLELDRPARVAGGSGESVFQPEWRADGVLHVISNRSGWGNVHRFGRAGRPDPGDDASAVAPVEGDEAEPQWVFGQSRYAFLDDGALLTARSADGLDHLDLITADGHRRELTSPYTWARGLRTFGSGAVAALASPVDEPTVVMVDVGDIEGAGARFVPLRPTRDLGVGAEWISRPEPLRFPTGDGRSAHALLYRPTHPTAVAPDDERPPLIVTIHGGPTSAARAYFNPALQYWTSRGFAVVDVNYRGSTGYGRAYQRLLDLQWGVADVEDCNAVAAFLADRGDVDPARLAIRGGSAGGTTALLALESGDRFAAAASSYGVTDMEALARDTHKFESRYLDTLIGPYPEARDDYVARSPIHHLERLLTPLIVFQGAEDEIVPPDQAEQLVAALRARGVPHAYLLFEGEQHGFRQADTLRRVLAAELSFYSQIFGFEPADQLDPVPVENLPD